MVTGASRGIGAAIARLAAERGFFVAVNFATGQPKPLSLLNKLFPQVGALVRFKPMLPAKKMSFGSLRRLERELGPIKALVNNAGITGGFSRVESVSAALLAQVMAVNVTGAILCAREAVRRMSTRHGGTGGAIVNISSRAAQIGSAGEWVHYAASKGAIDSFTIGLAREVATEGIRVNAVAPGLIETGLHAANGAPDRLDRLAATIPMQRPGTALEVAEGSVVAALPRRLLHDRRDSGSWRRALIAYFVSRSILPVASHLQAPATGSTICGFTSRRESSLRTSSRKLRARLTNA